MMKYIFTLGLLSLILVSGCNKSTKIDEEVKTGFEGMQISENFDWRMSRTVDISIFSKVEALINITSIDKLHVYHKGNHPGNSEYYYTKISVPNTINSLLVNGVEYDITSGQLDLTELQLKNMPASPIEGYGTDRGITLTNYALQFDGVDDYVDLGDITELNSVAAFTVEGWANQTTNTDTDRIFTKFFDSDNDIRLTTGGGSMFVEVGNGSDASGTWAAYSATISSGTWFHWAIVYDGAGGTDADRLKLYIDGNATPIVLSFSGTIPATTSASLSGNNAFLSQSPFFFDGYMDEVRIWDVARTGGQINTDYDKIFASPVTNLVANWRMDEGTGTTAFDETSSNYDATISGATWSTYSNAWDSDGDGVTDLNDDYPLDATRAFDNYFPAADTGTLVFEDIWPCFGDYDFNDLVMGYRFKTVTNASNEVVEIFGTFITRANGAILDNGFGFELPDAVAGILTNVEVSGYSHTQSIVAIDGTTKLETGQTNPVVIVIDDINNVMGDYSNTLTGWPYITPAITTIKIDVTGGGPFTAGDFSLATWNPFLIINQIRGYELHLYDYAPTNLVITNYFGQCSDTSVIVNDEYYRSPTHLPWALDFPVQFDYPKETISISDTYLHFVEWAESDKVLYTDWYTNTAAGYRNPSNIYPVP